MEMGTLVSWEKKEGDQLNEGDLLAEIETDKATMGFETPEEGYLAKILVPAGQKDIPIGKSNMVVRWWQLLCIIVSNKEDIEAFKDYKDTGELLKAGGGPPPAAPPKPAAAPPQAPPPPTPAAAAAPPPKAPAPRAPSPVGGARVFASPLARRLAADGGIDLRMVQGSGPGGRVRAQDLAGAPAGMAGPASAGFQDLPLDQLMQVLYYTPQRARVQQLVESKQTIPHYYLSVEAEVGGLLRVRDQLNSLMEKEGIKISLTDLVVKAAALACQQVPAANSSWQGTFIRQ
ncbi:DLAT [Cordylochernes scorpioides]|uniref:Dihydrolipoamide acetyltransferase component of pyruvate dehydrogenase complex n=1 Tax=Cordylochernes scorpioides TaxID=51811 RepID=A0ABY6L0L1_9ARAC|nr:DLAT [Cordylochernes scorpioides]